MGREIDLVFRGASQLFIWIVDDWGNCNEPNRERRLIVLDLWLLVLLFCSVITCAVDSSNGSNYFAHMDAKAKKAVQVTN